MKQKTVLALSLIFTMIISLVTPIQAISAPKITNPPMVGSVDVEIFENDSKITNINDIKLTITKDDQNVGAYVYGSSTITDIIYKQDSVVSQAVYTNPAFVGFTSGDTYDISVNYKDYTPIKFSVNGGEVNKKVINFENIIALNINMSDDSNLQENLYTGEISWTKALNENNIIGYKLYQAKSNGSSIDKIDNNPLVTIVKGSATKASITNIDLTKGDYIILVPYNDTNEFQKLTVHLVDKKVNDNKVTINIKDASGKPVSNVYTYISGNYYYNSGYSGTDGQYSFTGISNGDYYVYASKGSYYTSQNITKSNETKIINFEFPKMYSISGKVISNNRPVASVQMLATNDNGNYYYAYTDNNGNYTFNDIPSLGSVNIIASQYSNDYIPETKNIDISSDMTDVDFNLKPFGVVKGTVIKEDTGVTPLKAYVCLYKDNNTYISGSYVGSGGFSLSGIKESGNYKVVLNYVQENSWSYASFVSEPSEFFVDDLNNIPQNIKLTYKDPPDLLNSLTGNGNAVSTDFSIAQIGSKVSVTVKYKNNSNYTIDFGAFNSEFPNGILPYAGSQKHILPSLKPGEEGSYIFTVEVAKDIKSNFIKIPIKLNYNGRDYDFGEANFEIVNINLSGPGAIKSGQPFKVYGDATSGSSITIRDVDTGNVLASDLKPNGRWYSKELVFTEEKIYHIVAEANYGSTSGLEAIKSYSDILTIDCRADQITVKDVLITSYSSSSLPPNSVTGVPCFTVWVDPQLKGKDIDIYTTFENSESINSVTYHFADMDYSSQSTAKGYYGHLSGWGGAGLKQIKATVKTTDGRTLDFVIAEAVILIDPSGYVYDKVTGKTIDDVKVTCQILESGEWKDWNAELYGQVNPQYTDSEGKYGWMVLEGIYRVIAEKDGYKKFVTTDYPDDIPEINILPPRTDVNIGMTPIGGGSNIPYPTPSPSPSGSSSGSNDSSSSSSSSSDLDNSNQIPSSPNNIIKLPSSGKISSNEMDKLIEANKNKLVGVQGKDYKIIFEKGTMKKVEGIKEYDLTIKLNESEYKDKIKDLLLSEEYIIVHFNYNDKLPAKAKITLLVGKEYAGKTLEYKYYNPKNNELTLLQTVQVDKDGYVIVEQEQGGDYIFVVKKEDIIESYDLFTNINSFTDIKSHWAKDDIEFAIENNLFSGVSKDIFSPDTPMTRAMFVTVLGRYSKIDTSSKNDSLFKDVDSKQYYAPYINWAFESGIVNGISSSEFAPNDPITREQMSVLIYNYSKFNEVNIDEDTKNDTFKFTDDSSISDWAKDIINKMGNTGLISGKGNNTFDPKGIATRAESASILKRYIEKIQ